MDPGSEAAWRAALDRDGLGRLVDQLLAERAELRKAAVDLGTSRAWRGAHAVMLLLARASGRATQDGSALDVLQARLDRPFLPPSSLTRQWPSVQPRRRNCPSADVLASLEEARPVSVVVPIHNAAEALERCLASLVRNTNSQCHLILVDDGSTDSAVAHLLDRQTGRFDVTVLRHESPLGFAAAVNRGLRETEGGDVVLLNSDTEVPPRWLQGLTVAAHCDPAVATATPLSNNAGLFSMPTPRLPNPLPAGLDPDDVGRLIDRSSLRRYPPTPSGGGFCLYIKREALEAIGPLDAVNFPRGYGEESDWCMRAGQAGWSHVIDDATFVFHRRGESFGAERARLGQAAEATIARRHPTYPDLIRSFVSSRALAEVSSDVRRTVYATPLLDRPRRRVLVVDASGPGERDPGSDLRGEDEVVVLDQAESRVRLVRAGASDPWPLAEWSDEEDAALQVLVGYGVELVEISYAAPLAPRLRRLARTLHLPVRERERSVAD